MTSKGKELVKTVYGWVLSALILIAAVCLWISCVHIYRSGPSPFSPESVAKQWNLIAVPMILCVLGVIGGGILSVIWKDEPKKQKGFVSQSMKLKKQLERCRWEENSGIAELLNRQKKQKNLLLAVGTGLSVLSALPTVIHCSQLAHFTVENLNADIRAAFLTALPFLIIAGSTLFLLPYLEERRATAALEAVRKAMADGNLERIPKAKPAAGNEQDPAPRRMSQKNKLLALRLSVLTIGIVLVAVGICNGGMKDVLHKAIRICTECIGLG